MLHVSPAASALARRVLLYEAGGSLESAALAEAAARADARLRGRLADLIGLTGYTTLVARAMRLAEADVPALRRGTGGAGAVGADDGRHGVSAWAGDADPAVVAAGATAFLTHVIGLLITFIGADLALRLVRDAWPELGHDQDNHDHADAEG